MRFVHPEALWLLPLWCVAAWLRPRTFLRPLRVLTALLFLVAWLDPHVNRKTPGLDVWMLADRSASAAETVGPRLAEMETLLRESRGTHDRLFVVEFAEEAVRRDELSGAVLTGRRDATAVGETLQYTLSMLEENRHARLLLVSDGHPTDPVDRAGERLVEEGVPLDLRLIRPSTEGDVRVDRFSVPMRTRPGEPFLIEARVVGPAGASFAYTLLRDGRPLAEGRATLRRGGARLRWTGEMRRAGAAEYAVRVEAEGDTFIGNNRQSRWVEARGRQRLLLVTAYPDDPIAPILRSSGVAVEVVTEPTTLNPGSLSGAAAVMIHNVYAADVPRPFLEALPFYVNEQGGGLVMIGGKASFGSGGYFESPIDELLPVSMELKEEDRKLAVALGIVMDRSGSMSASAGGMTKMDMANAGAARAIELLGGMDAVTVFAVDTKAHEIAPLSRVGPDREELASLVRRVRSTGGGIYVFNGLEAVWEELKSAPQNQRHVILFSDAADSEQPGGVGRLIREMRGQNTTVSVIALGTEKDADAPFLKQIADDGGGRIFFNTDPSTLPEVFAQETVTVSRSAFLDDPVGLRAAAGWRELAAAPLKWPSAVDGYNLSYLREGAAESLRTTDEYAAPLLAHWRRGAGRSAAVAFPLGGEHSATVRNWEQYGDLVRTLSRWAMRPETPPGLALRLERVGETVRVRLHADGEWRNRFSLDAPRLVVRSDRRPEAREPGWRRMRPGLLETEFDLEPNERMRGALRVGEHTVAFGPVSGAQGAEWRFDPDGPRELRRVAAASGGVERTDLASIWKSPRRMERRGTWTFWLLAALAVFLCEALWNRLGGQRLEIDFSRDGVRKERPARSERKKSGTVESKKEPDEPAPRGAFRKARHGR